MITRNEYEIAVGDASGSCVVYDIRKMAGHCVVR